MDAARPAGPPDSLSSTYCLQQVIAIRRNVITSRSLFSLKSFTDMPSALPAVHTFIIINTIIIAITTIATNFWLHLTSLFFRSLHLLTLLLRWMCGVKLNERKKSEELRELLGLEPVSFMIKNSRLRWFGHVERKDDNDWVKHCITWEFEGLDRGQPKKTWWDCVKNDMESLGLSQKTPVPDCVYWLFHY